MELTIGGKEYQLQFGLRFINELDNIYTQKIDGMEFGMGVESLMPYLQLENPMALMNVIKAGTIHLNTKPSNNDIEQTINEYAEKDELGELFEVFQNALETAPLLKGKMKKVQEAAQKVQEAQQ